MTIFRPSIDIIDGKVTVRRAMFGGDTTAPPSDDPLYYAAIFKKHNLTGGHVFIHGPGGEEVTKKVLELWPQGFAVAGDVTDATGPNWLKLGASKVIVRSWLFPDGKFNEERLRSLSALVGSDKLIVDVSCRRIPPKEGSSEPRWKVALNSWKTLTDTEVNEDSILVLSSFVSELLVHPADENGKQMQIDEELVRKLAKWATVPVTYAGGARNAEDLVVVDRASDGSVDLVIGSALDIYGGKGVTLEQVLKWNAEHGQEVVLDELPATRPESIKEPEPEQNPQEQARGNLTRKLTRMKTQVQRVATEARGVERPVGDYCALCGCAFNWLWWRYECPNCGRFVCRDHSSHKAQLRLKYTSSGPERVCDLCFVELAQDGRQAEVDWTQV